MDIWNVECFANALPSFNLGTFGREEGEGGRMRKGETGTGKHKHQYTPIFCESMVLNRFEPTHSGVAKATAWLY